MLDKIRSSDKSHRNYHIKLKDKLRVRNYAFVSDLNNRRFNQEHATSVYLFVKRQKESGSINLYKSNHVLDLNYPNLKEEGFVIGLLNDF